MLETNINLFTSLSVLRSRTTSILVVADGRADNFGWYREKILVKRTHHHHRPFHKAGRLNEKAWIFNKLYTLRES